MLSLTHSKERQARLLAHMHANEVSAAVISNPRVVYYFSGVLVDRTRPQAFALLDDGRSLLVSSAEPAQSAADKTIAYTAYALEKVFSSSTMDEEVNGAVREFVGAGRGKIGIELESAPASLPLGLQREYVDLTPAIRSLRRHKEPDELESIAAAIRITEAGYAAIRASLEPGMTELYAYRVIEQAMIEMAQSPIQLQGDFGCGNAAVQGGPPTTRKVLPGDLYVLDLFPDWQGYRCDLCRTFAASETTALQRDAWAHILEAHRIASRIIRPGVPAREVYLAVRAHLETFEPARGSFTHHLGHGVGMDAWEFPWLTPGSDHIIQEGDVVACEPGLYSRALQGGIRLEHNYLVGKDGVTALDQFPLDL